MAGEIVAAIQNHFLTQGHNKNQGNGISESVVLVPTQQVLGSNLSWGKELTFHDGNTDQGQAFGIAGAGIKVEQLPDVEYRWMMDKRDEWDVFFKIIVTLVDGRQFIVFQDAQPREINGGNPKGPPDGAIRLRNPL